MGLVQLAGGETVQDRFDQCLVGDARSGRF